MLDKQKLVEILKNCISDAEKNAYEFESKYNSFNTEAVSCSKNILCLRSQADILNKTLVVINSGSIDFTESKVEQVDFGNEKESDISEGVNNGLRN